MNGPSLHSHRIEAHYARENSGDLSAAILAALAGAGKDPDRLRPEDLAPIDEFHIGGRKATLELARKIGFDRKMRVLDVGSGVGGPSRSLALEFGCRVTGLDLTEEYCRAATMLARRLGLNALVSYRHGDALDMPFGDGSFDALWTQHASMNIDDKERLYGEMWRVLKPGGVLAIYDILAGGGGPAHFPVPWAREPSISFLIEPEEMRRLLEGAGFEILSWKDKTEEGRAFFRRLGERLRKSGPPPPGIEVLLGPDFRAMARNQIRNLEENRIALIEATVRRKGE